MKTKIVLLTFLYLIRCFCFGQTGKKSFVKIKINTLKKTRSINQLIPNLPNGCEVKIFDYTSYHEGRISYHEYIDQTGDTLQGKNNWRFEISKNITPGFKFWIDIKEFTCKRSIQKNYCFVVVE